MKTIRYSKIGLLLILACLVAASLPAQISPIFENRAFAASLQPADSEETESPVVVHDPYEKFNRKMFALNDKIYFWVFKPVTTLYSAYFPPGVRTAVRNGFKNLLFPVRFVNCALQGKMDKAGTETARFVINSTMGVGGLFDVADRNFSIRTDAEDFGQTLATWGAGSGPYLMVPILGPSNVRDLSGTIVDSFMDPIYYIPAPWWAPWTVDAGGVMNTVSLTGSEYEELKKSALDPYVAMRDGYGQYRKKEISK